MTEKLPDDSRAVRYTIVGLFSVAALISLAMNLVAIAVVLGIYSVLNGQFEIILASVLIMIYAKIDAYVHDSTEELSDVKKLVGVTSGAQTPKEDFAVSLGARAVTALTRLIAVSLIQLIALWNLVKAIGWI